MSIKDETQIVEGEIVKPEEGRPSWKNRKKVIFATLIFCAFCIMYIMFQGNDTRVNETIILGCFGLGAAVIGSYVFGAAWTDISIEKIKSDGARQPIQNTTPPQLPPAEDGKEPEIIDRLANGKGPDD